jgi:hypothetical protein
LIFLVKKILYNIKIAHPGQKTSMLSFSHYIKSRQAILPRGPEEIAIWLPEWLQSIQETLTKLHRKKLISLRIYTISTESLSEWQNNPTQYIKQHKAIESIDALYQQIIFFIKNDIAFSERKLEILGGYPFSSSVSGVTLEVRLVMQDEGPLYQLVNKNQTSSAVGSRTYVNLGQQIKTRIGEIAWLQESMNQLKFSITGQLLNKPHAELIWCIEHSEELFDYIKNQPIFSRLPLLNDDFPHEQLIQTPRLEIITSSACCGNCRMLFNGLRWRLEKNNIHLPIVLYADSPYNDTTIHHEMHGSVYVILSSGTYFNTQVQCNVPKRKHPVQKKIPLEMCVHKNLNSKEKVDYLCLLYLGGIALLDLLACGLPEKKQDTINPMTYLAPDTLILYAAEKLPHVSAIRYLAKTLEQIDMRLLVDWRITFRDQLHWLLMSKREPKFRDNARKSLSATNISFLIENDVHGDTDAQKFYKNFRMLWKAVKNIKIIYHLMLVHYTEQSSDEMLPSIDQMPLGMMVGPLSKNMRDRVFIRDSEQSVRMLHKVEERDRKSHSFSKQ